MTIYNIQIEIKTNTAPENLFYDMEVYKTDLIGNKTYALRPTGKQQLQAGNNTKTHPSIDIIEIDESSYIMSIELYRKAGVNYIKVTPNPLTAITPLKGFLTGDKDWGASREFSYYETSQKTQKSQNGQVNTYTLNISSKPRIFEAKEHGIGDVLDPFTLIKVEDELRIRMMRPAPEKLIPDYQLPMTDPKNQAILAEQDERERVLFYPNQDQSMFCGAAAFFYCIQKDRPDIYQQLIKELWESGETKIGTLKIKADNSVRHPKGFFEDDGTPKLPAVDWITMASLRDTENTGLFSINSPSAGFLWWNHAGAITMWGVLEKWFKEAGATKKYSNISIAHSNLRDVCTLNNYMTSDSHVVSLIRAGMLTRGANALTKDHWVVWNDKLRLKDGTEVTTSTPLSSQVKLEMFSWGGVYQQLDHNVTLKSFLSHTFGGMVFTKIP